MHSVYKHAYLNTLLYLHSAIMLCMVEMPLKGVVGGRALNGLRNYIVDREKTWKNHAIVFLNFCGNPECWFNSNLLKVHVYREY